MCQTEKMLALEKDVSVLTNKTVLSPRSGSPFGLFGLHTDKRHDNGSHYYTYTHLQVAVKHIETQQR